jgi:ParB-like chromosome segregation protein Spo0J
MGNCSTSRTLRIPPADLVVDPGLQPRLAGIDPEHVAALAETPEAWPPLVAVEQGGALVVVDGQHRLKAAELLGLEAVAVEVRRAEGEADLRDMAFALNLRHGRPLALADRRRYALSLLKRRPTLADREVARRAGLSPTTVGELRRAGERTGELAASALREGARGYTLALEPSVQPGRMPRVAARLERALQVAEAILCLPGGGWPELAELYLSERGTAAAQLLAERLRALALALGRLSRALAAQAEKGEAVGA